MRIYVAGPMTGYPNFNFPAFDQATADLRELGHEVCNPAEHDREVHGDAIENCETGDVAEAAAVGFSLRDALNFDLGWITSQADAVAVLDGWERSKGARAEVATALALGLLVRPADTFEPASNDYQAAPEGYLAQCITELPTMPNALDAIIAASAGMYEHEDEDPNLPNGEVRTVSSSGGEKGVKPARFDLIPARPLWTLAELYGYGAAKYADRNWEAGYEWSKSFGAMMRHAWEFWMGVDIDDPEAGGSGLPHLASVAFHAFALMEWMQTHPEFDDRPATEAARPLPAPEDLDWQPTLYTSAIAEAVDKLCQVSGTPRHVLNLPSFD